VTIAVLGCGSIGTRHARNAAALGHDVIVFDTDPARARHLARELGVVAAASPDDVWSSRPAAAIVATPSAQHVPLALAAVRLGCDVFVEKPLGSTLDGVPDLIDEARARNLVTLVGCNMRFHPGPATVKRLLNERAIGDVAAARLYTGSYLPDWRPGQDYRASYSASAQQGGGAILDCIHEIDLALWYFGPARLSAAIVRPAASLGLAVDGLAELLLEHERGVVSSVHLNFVQRDYQRGCQIIGSTGTLRWDFAGGVTLRRGTTTDTIGMPDGWSLNQMYVDELAHFIESVTTRQPTIAPLENGRAALEIALTARDRHSVSRGVPA